MAGELRGISIAFCVCLLFNAGCGYIRKISEHEMCNGTITLGDGLYAVSLDFDFLFNIYTNCRTVIHIPESYNVAYRFLSYNSVFQACESRLNLTYNNGDSFFTYEFCNFNAFHRDDVFLENPKQIKLDFSTELDSGEYEMLMYIFYPNANKKGCNRLEISCTSGRCIDRGLFCDRKYDFCADGTLTGLCTDEGTPSYDTETSYNKLNVIGPACLGLFTLLMLIFVLYLCCKNKTLRRLCGLPETSNQRTRRSVTARDVYIINVTDVGGTPEEGYDYVMDYKKFSEPPDYNSLGNIAEASVRYTNSNNNNNNNASNYTESEGVYNDVSDGTTGGGNTNEGFIQDGGDELPGYDHVMTNAEEYSVNHNHL